ncbi:MAG TPA: hypothetical protein VMQ44_01540, partial [Candidatus Saccharimonadales bacterium]|nr:hypothetical protein [Candidatus Saccharimonadales bacterium]
MTHGGKVGSALLLTITIVAVLTVTTLGGIAVKFDQFLATSRIKDSAVAKSAAQSGVELLNQKLATGSGLPDNNTAKVYDLTTTTNPETSKSDSDIANLRPNPRKSLVTLQKVKTNLPRCIAVGVISPWTNDAQYLYSNQATSSPALIFHYANIVSDTDLGSIPDDSNLSTAAKNTPISDLTNMGHFYNPYAPNGTDESMTNYWTINMGGPNDEFLTHKGPDNVKSYYQNLDLIYVPYLPRFIDSGLSDNYNDPGSFHRNTAAQIQTKFEGVITANSFKVWIDGAADNSYVYKYGFGNLFNEGTTQNAVNWLQPNLWNDTAEADSIGNFFTTSNLDNGSGAATATTWAKQTYPTYATASNGWSVSVIKGAQSMAFMKFSSGTFTTATSISGVLYGPLDGIRLNKYFSIKFYNATSGQPFALDGSGTSPGVWNNAYFTKLDTTSTAGVVNATVSFVNALPKRANCTPTNGSDTSCNINLSEISVATVGLAPMMTASASTAVNITNGTTLTLATSTDCTLSTTFSGCPTVGDLISLSNGSTKLWAKVSGMTFSSDGTKLTTLTVGALYQMPPPVRSNASVTYGSGNATTIAYYGGQVDMNDYDGGANSEIDDLWLYTPESTGTNGGWTFKPNGGTSPGRLAGASLVYDAANNRLILFGGYRHEPTSSTTCGATIDYTKYTTCLYTNQGAARIAKHLNSDTYSYNLATSTWSKITPPAAPALTQNVDYQVQVLSTLPDRSGLDGWQWSTSTGSGTFSPTVGGTNTLNVGNISGFAVGDDIFLNGVNANGVAVVTAWAKVTLIDTP